MKKALVTGTTGQDGSYLIEFLLKKGIRSSWSQKKDPLHFNTQRIDHIFKDPHEVKNNFFLHFGDLTDSTNISRIIKTIEPDEIYNLGAQSHVAVSFELPIYTSDVNALGSLRILEAIRELDLDTKILSGFIIGVIWTCQEIPQKESTPFYPRSPYAVSKLFAYWITVNYRGI